MLIALAARGVTILDKSWAAEHGIIEGMFRTWHRVVVILILSWAVVDDCVPGFCMSDSPPGGSGTHAVINRSSSHASLGTTVTKNDRRQDTPEPVDDDCFCCSAHVMPTPHFMFAESAAPTPEVALLGETHATHASDWRSSITFLVVSLPAVHDVLRI